METLNYIIEKFGIDISKPSPFYLQIGRFKDLPRLFNELGFKVGAEVGVYQGDYSRWLLKMMPGLKLYGVDAWTSYQGYKDFRKNDIVESYDRAVKNTEGFDCTLIKGWSNEVVDQFEDGSLDFVFIDGNHSYEWAVWDIAKWSKKVRKGGIVYGHDYDDYSGTKRWNEMNVINAVDGWTKSYKIHPWFITTKNKNKCWMYVSQ
jgi:hypothetical protein